MGFISNYDVITIGDAKLDTFLVLSNSNGGGLCRLDDGANELCFKHGQKIPVERTYFSVGGNAANVAIGLSRLGLKTTIAAEIGDDEFSLKIINTLAKEHIDRGYIKQDRNRESSLSVAITYKDDRTLFSEHIDRKHEFNYHHAKSNWLYLTSLGHEWETPYRQAIDYINEHQASLAFNPGTLQLEEKSSVLEKVLKSTTILFVNKDEAKQLIYSYANEYNSDDIQEILSNVKALGPKTVVLTNGDNGSFVLDDDNNYFEQKHAPTKILELTGAGDAFATGFLAGRIYNLSLQDCMKWGNLNSASVIEKMGAEEGLLKKAEMEEKIAGFN